MSKSPAKEKGVKCFHCSKYGYVVAKCSKIAVNSRIVDKNKDCNVTRTNVRKSHKTVVITEKEQLVLIDTSSDLSLMRADFYVKIGAPALVSKQTRFRRFQWEQSIKQDEYHDRNWWLFIWYFHVVPDKFLQVEVWIKQGIVNIFKIKEESSELWYLKWIT